MSERKRILVFLIVMILIIPCSFLVFKGSNNSTLDNIKTLVESRFIKEYDREKFEEYAAKAAVASLDDKYSDYLSAEEYNAMINTISGKYHGIGVEVYLNEDEKVEILSVIEMTPAETAGLMTGDIILCVDGFEITRESYAEAISRIQGKDDENNEIELTVSRNGAELKIPVKRSDIQIDTVYAKDIQNYKYLKITSFSSETVTAFEKETENISVSYDGLIIDLRNNPGGMLDSVVKVADMLLPEGEILYTKSKNGKKHSFKSDKSFIDIPLVILINSESASASEVLSGAIKDHGRGTLVGEKTYGKGCVQSLFALKNGGVLKLTTDYYYSPNGNCIEGTGIEPDIEVMLPSEIKNTSVYKLSFEQDLQLQKAVEVLNNN